MIWELFPCVKAGDSLNHSIHSPLARTHSHDPMQPQSGTDTFFHLKRLAPFSFPHLSLSCPIELRLLCSETMGLEIFFHIPYIVAQISEHLALMRFQTFPTSANHLRVHSTLCFKNEWIKVSKHTLYVCALQLRIFILSLHLKVEKY